MYFHRTLVFAICSSLVMLIGCAGYVVTVNEQPVRRPEPLLTPGKISDENLANCIEQTIADNRIRRAEQLTQLVCTYGGIEDLAGLQQFSQLQRLDIRHNALTELKPLYTLAELQLLQVEDNPGLSCGSLETLASLREDQLTIAAPEHCR